MCLFCGDDNLLSNMSLNTDDPELIKQAAKNKDYHVYVNPKAFDEDGHLLNGFFAVHSNEHPEKDHGPFWEEYERLLIQRNQHKHVQEVVHDN